MQYSDMDASGEVSEQKVVRIVAHQLNTPLTAIKWSSEILASPNLGQLNEEQRTCVSDIREAAERSIGLGRDLVALFHLYFKTPLESTHVTTQALLQNILDDVHGLVTSKNLVLNLDVSPESANMHGPLEQLRLIMGAMISNAVKYSTPNGAIGVSVRAASAQEITSQGLPIDKNYVYVSVSDTGMGIPKTDQPNICAPFFRGENVQAQHIPGEGLGLYIAQLAIERLVGKLWFGSEEGKGSSFYALIPMQ